MVKANATSASKTNGKAIIGWSRPSFETSLPSLLCRSRCSYVNSFFFFQQN